MRSLVTHIAFLLLLVTNGEVAYAATAAPVEVGPIQVFPGAPLTGQHLRITARIKRTTSASPLEPLVVNVIAVVVRPDHLMKSWVWNKVSLARYESKELSLPADAYDIKLAGNYKIEFNVYSADMNHRLAARSTTFSVVNPSLPAESKAPARLEAPRRGIAERNYFGVGIYGNALDPAGGATLILWPFRNVGLQGTYTVGTFTSYEARLLVKFEPSWGFRPYIGVGYVSVSKESDVIGIKTEFKDSGVSGAAGVEIPLSRRTYGYVEVSGAKIDLEKIVTNGAQTVNASVKYYPVTIGAGIVFYLF